MIVIPDAPQHEMMRRRPGIRFSSGTMGPGSRSLRSLAGVTGFME
jgi:hypothetical protein